MDSELREAMVAGVFLEFCDACGNTVGQALFTGWQGRVVPSLGDLVSCAVISPVTRRKQKLLGRVRERHFELQHEADGRPCVWARLLLETVTAPLPRRGSVPRVRFSVN